jgi:hypothetical protein
MINFYRLYGPALRGLFLLPVRRVILFVADKATEWMEP